MFVRGISSFGFSWRRVGGTDRVGLTGSLEPGLTTARLHRHPEQRMDFCFMRVVLMFVRGISGF